MIPYVLYSSLILSVSYVFYKIILSRTTLFHLNRWFLISCIFLSFVLPLIPVPAKYSWRAKDGNETITLSLNNEISGQAAPPVITQKKLNDKPAAHLTIPFITNFNYHTLYYFYYFGVILLGLYLVTQIIATFYQASVNPVIRDQGYKIVEISSNKAACSFGNIIFINPGKYDWQIYDQIIQHEKIHIKERHTIDIMLAEIAIILQWFNPFAWLFRKALEENLEYLTDSIMIDKHKASLFDYQTNLLKVVAPNFPMGITTNYNQSQLKKRIFMMNSKKSSIYTSWKYLFFLPILICLICIFNDPLAVAKSVNNPVETAIVAAPVLKSTNEVALNGAWIAIIKNDSLDFSLKMETKDGPRTMNFLVPLKEMSTFDNTGGNFLLTRDAGTLTLNGKFDKNEGTGHFNFHPNNEFGNYLSEEGVGKFNSEGLFELFTFNISKQLIAVLVSAGYKPISRENLYASKMFGIDPDYITMWKKYGYKDLSLQDIISLKMAHIDEKYVKDIQQTGFDQLLPEDLIKFKSQDIDYTYIKEINSLVHGNQNVKTALTPEEVFQTKFFKLDIPYLQSIKEYGYLSLPLDKLFVLKSNGITADFIKSYTMLGYHDIPPHFLVWFKEKRITPAFIKGFNNLGYYSIPLETIFLLFTSNIDSAYVSTMKEKGIAYKDLTKYIQLKNSLN